MKIFNKNKHSFYFFINIKHYLNKTMNKLNVKIPFTMAVVCFLFSTSNYVKAQKQK